jgi:diguanylate cyclase (GGDEF)-like protein
MKAVAQSRLPCFSFIISEAMSVLENLRRVSLTLFVAGVSSLGVTPADGAVVLIGEAVESSIERELEVLARDDLASIEDVSRAHGWVPAGELSRREGAIWGRLRIDSGSAAPGVWLLEADHAWDLVELFVRQPGQWLVVRTGQSIPVADLPVDHPGAFLPIRIEDTLRPGGAVVYLRFVRAPGEYGRPMGFLERIGPAVPIMTEERREAMFDGAFAGVAFAMAIYNFFLYLTLKDRTRLWYTIYVVTFALFWVVGKGLLAEILWPGFPGRGYSLDFVFICASVVFGTLFARDFLHVPECAPRLRRYFDVVIVAPIVALVLGAAGAWVIAENLAAIAALSGFVLYILAGFVVLRTGFTPARYFLVAWGTLSCGGIPYILAYFGLLPVGSLVRNGPRVAAAIEMVLLALALGSRIRVLEREHRESQVLYTTRLERDVRERTSDLEAANANLRRLNARLEDLSLTDELTGIANRRLFDVSLEQEWRRATRAGTPIAVVIGDVDHFKPYNDHYGHPQGDVCLRQVAEALSEESRRAGELVARYGGEEFGVILPGLEVEDAARRAEEMRQRVESLAIRHQASPVAGVVTISFGVACVTPTPDGVSTGLVREADLALYRAKKRGRNRVVSA